jgi:hypothetical protein
MGKVPMRASMVVWRGQHAEVASVKLAGRVALVAAPKALVGRASGMSGKTVPETRGSS